MPDRHPWTAEDIPNQSNRTAIVTGANSGLGFETARALAGKGAHVVMACRDVGRAQKALELIQSENPDASIEARELDLAQLASIRKFSEGFLGTDRPLNILCNNAGVMALPYRKTADGFEMQFGTNHLGHFALTGLLLDRLLATDGGRIVTVSSTMHVIGSMRFDDLQRERSYSKWMAYGQSKLANLLFTYELQRRLEAKAAPASALSSHPGYAATNLQTAGPRMEGSAFMERGAIWLNRIASQSAAMGALPSLYAATAPEAKGGDYFGPGGFLGQRGHPKKVSSTPRSRNGRDAARLWQISEELTGIQFAELR
jgi:NAD(P)-dependent dehydrogenase (short-subunit alcohol dehydrogenase family)